MKTIVMPQFGETPGEAVAITRWLIEVGDRIETGEKVAEIETDKTQMSVETTISGRVGRILAEEGTSVIPGTAIVEIEEDG